MIDKVQQRMQALEEFSRENNFTQIFIRSLWLGMDYLAMYKQKKKEEDHVKHRFKHCLHPELRMKRTYLDYHRIILDMAEYILLSYIAIKYVLTITLTIMAHHLTTVLHQTTNHDDLTRSHIAQRRSQLISLIESIGDPFSNTPGLSVLLHAIVIADCAISIAIIVKYKMCSINFVAARIIDEPAREIRRIDLVIADTMDHTLSSILRVQSNQCFNNNQHEFDIYRKTRRISHMKHSGICFEAAMLIYQNELHTLRPQVYSLDWAREFCVKGKRLALTIFCFMGPIVVFVLKMAINGAKKQKCDIKKVDRCNILTAFSTPDRYALIEYAIGATIVTLLAFLALWLIILLTDMQRYIIRSIMKSLLEGLFCLERADLLDFQLSDEEQLGCSKIMLRNLVRIKLSMEELSQIADLLCDICSFALGACFFSIVISLAVDEMSRESMRNVRLAVFSFVLSCNNLVMGVTAYSYSKCTKLETLGWSILAKFVKKTGRENVLITSDFIANGWRKLIKSRLFRDERNSVRPFNISITYEMMLQMNFFIVTLISLMPSLLFSS